MGETLYVVFGEHTEKAVEYLKEQGFDVTGSDRTLDAAAIMASNMEEQPDSYLVLGSALVTGVVDVGINYSAELLENLKKLRLSSPKSRIILILPERVEDELLKGILYLGIYDVYMTNSLSLSQLPGMIEKRKTIADFGIGDLPAPVRESRKREIEVEESEEEKKETGSFLKGFRERFESLAEKMRRKEKPQASGERPFPEDFSEETPPQEEDCFSAGTAVLGKDAFNVEDLLKAADEAFYRAKKNGRNRVEAFDRQAPEASAEEESWKPEGETFVYQISPYGDQPVTYTAGEALDIPKEEASGIPEEETFSKDCQKAFPEGSGEKLRKKKILHGKVVLISPLGSSSSVEFVSLFERCLAEKGCRWTVLVEDVNSSSFEKSLDSADALIWAASEPGWETAVSWWKKRPRSGCREIIVLLGRGDPDMIEEAFVLPCFHVRKEREIEKLIDLLTRFKKGAKVVFVGFRESIPEVPGFIFDTFKSAVEASVWAEYNPPDAAVIHKDLKDLPLLEYDLKKLGIPVVKTENSSAFLKKLKTVN
ncbi:MAG TPA: hypothetical protein DEA47_01045 [Peptococcaceae bacterium]|nr:MAG: hypothetical protein XD50_0278 [Clostridia bacterium 41_269]HBT19951.1 hypothetical protein [Peptococcaceae bacterium]